MEKKKGFAGVGCSTILWGVLMLFLCAAPIVRADVTVPADEEWPIDYDVGGFLTVNGTANILTGAVITLDLQANASSKVNIKGGTIGDGAWFGVTVSIDQPAAVVTVYGTDFEDSSGPIAGSSWTPRSEGEVLSGKYEGGTAFSILVKSDFPITLASPPIHVEVDIKPGSYPNPINPGSNGLIPVAIFTTETFDAATVDPDSVTVAGAEVAVRGKSEKLMAHLEDVDGDGDIDLLLQVDTQSDGELWETGPVTLVGKTYDGTAIEGTDDVVIVPPE